jgi:hypothetical protein
MDTATLMTRLDPANRCECFAMHPRYRCDATRLIIWAHGPLGGARPAFIQRRLSRDACYLVDLDALDRDGEGEVAWLVRVTRRAIPVFVDAASGDECWIHPGRYLDARGLEADCPTDASIQSMVTAEQAHGGFWLFDPEERDWDWDRGRRVP